MEREVRKQRIRDLMLQFPDDFRDVGIKGGMVVFDICDLGMEKTEDGKGSGGGGGGIIELPKTKGGEAESGSKEEGSSATAKPVGVRKRTKMVKHRIDISSKPVFEIEKEPIQFNLSLHSEAFAVARRNYLETIRSILEQFETKGYAEYEREVTDDEEDPNPV